MTAPPQLVEVLRGPNATPEQIAQYSDGQLKASGDTESLSGPVSDEFIPDDEVHGCC